MSVDASAFLPGAYSYRNPQGGTPNFQVPDAVPGFIGRTLGKSAVVSNEAVTRGGTPNTADALANSNVRRIIKISNTSGGPADYQENNQFVLTGDTVDWTDAVPLLAPVLGTPIVTSGAGGTWSGTGTYYFVISALDAAGGETLKSTEVSAVVAATTDSVTLRWSRVPNAAQYKIFMSSVSGTYGASSLLATIASGDTTEHVEDSGTLGTGQPVVANTSEDEPVAAGTYYVTYEYADYATLEGAPRRYSVLSDVYRDHGIGSQVAQMAELAMSTQSGRGNGAAAVWIAGVQNDDDAAYQTALTNFRAVSGEVLLMVMDKRSTVLDVSFRNHIVDMNGVEAVRKVRIGISWNSPSGSTAPSIGDSSTPGTILYDAAQNNTLTTTGGEPNGFNMFHVIPDSGGATGLISNTAGVVAETNLDGYHVAAALAGMAAALPDAGEPLTRKPVAGLVNMRFTEYTDPQIKQLRDGGVMVVDNVNGFWQINVGTTVRRNGLEEEKYPNISIADKVIAIIWHDEIDPPGSGSTSRRSLIGRKITDGLLDKVGERTESALDRALQKGCARNYDVNAINAVQGDGVNAPKTQISVSYSYVAFFPALVILAERRFDVNQSG